MNIFRHSLLTYISIALLFLGVLYLYNDYSEIMELKEAHKEWVVVTEVEEKLVNIARASGSSHRYWLVTVRLNNKSSYTLPMADNPAPTVDACLPVIVGHYATGGTIVVLDANRWTYGESFGASCT